MGDVLKRFEVYRIYDVIENKARKHKVLIMYSEPDPDILAIKLIGKWENTSEVEKYLETLTLEQLGGYESVRYIHITDPESVRYARRRLFFTSRAFETIVSLAYKLFMPLLIGIFIAIIYGFILYGRVH